MGEIFERIDGILCEVRNDVSREELQKTLADIKNYFCEHLPQYEVVKIRRKSFHQDDKHLYMVAAKKKDGTFAVWTSWNALLETLNHGHYDLLDFVVCDRIMSEFYNAEERC